MGTPRQVYDQPADWFVASFVGSPGITRLECEAWSDRDGPRVQPIGAEPATMIGPQVGSGLPGLTPNSKHRLDVGVRPERVTIVADTNARPVENSGPRLLVPATVARLEFQGHSLLVTLKFGPQSVLARISPRDDLRMGGHVSRPLDLSGASLGGSRHRASPGAGLPARRRHDSLNLREREFPERTSILEIGIPSPCATSSDI